MNITVLLPAGRLPLDIMGKARDLAEQYNLGVYLSTVQNLRLINVPDESADAIKGELAALGAQFKGPGKFPLPRVCVGMPHCNLGIIDTEKLSEAILARFKDKAVTKPKFKIAVSGCNLSCSGVLTTDIGVMATRAGFEVYVGGKGGPYPKVGRRILRKATEDEVLEAIEKLVNFHDAHTVKKQRMFKLIDHPDFPYPEAV
ncbi:MAG: nitrite reductase [Deltaproteobacteria bacterium]|nr:nitrite reductase [Deltaproteobacteria bacterium]